MQTATTTELKWLYKQKSLKNFFNVAKENFIKINATANQEDITKIYMYIVTGQQNTRNKNGQT